MAPETAAVVGGGAVGLTAAAHLARRGVAVTLYERGGVASGSTGRAAGICYDAFADRRDADIAADALARFRELAAETRLPVTDCPYVWLAREGDDARADAIREQVPQMHANGRDVSLLAPAALGERFPALRTDDVAVAAVAEDAVYTDPETYAAVVAERARAAGAEVLTDTPVALADGPAVETPDGRADYDAVLVAAGAGTKQLLAGVGIQVPVEVYRAQALVTEPTRASGGLPSLYDATRHVYWRPDDSGLLVGDGTETAGVDADGFDPTADDWFVTDAIQRVHESLAPGADVPTGARRAWAGLCTATPDRDPLLGACGGGFSVAVGWHGHGFMRAPALGRRVAEAVLGGDGVPSFDPDRFDGDEEFTPAEGMTIED